MGLVLRNDKGAKLTYDEMDDNFIYLDNKNAISADKNPSSSDDVSKGFVVGSEWINLDTQTRFRCSNASADEAEWNEIEYGVRIFTALDDTPNGFSEQKGKILVVNNDETALEFQDKPKGTLEKLDEGNGIGYRVSDRDPDKYAPIGEEAIDFSVNRDDDDNDVGASFAYSMVLGINNKEIIGDGDADKQGINFITGYSNKVENINDGAAYENTIFGADNTIKTEDNNSAYQNLINGDSNTINAKDSDCRIIFINGSNNVVDAENDGYIAKSIINGYDNIVKTDGDDVACSILSGDHCEFINASFSLSSGERNKVHHSYTATSGYRLNTSHSHQVIFGKYNDDADLSLVFMYGNGTADDERSNLIELADNGAIYIDKMVGLTDDRPTLKKASSASYFDTDLGKPIWYNGSDWVDANGDVV